MSTQPTPTPPAPAEVCERLKNWQWFCENTAKAFLRYEMPIEHIKELGETPTSALLLIEQGEKERERFGMNIDQLASHAMHLENNVIADLRAQLAAATERVKRLSDATSKYFERVDMVNRGVAESVELIGLRHELEDAARAQPTTESK